MLGLAAHVPPNPAAISSYNMNALSMYANQNEARKRALAMAAASGANIGSSPRVTSGDHMSSRSAPPNIRSSAAEAATASAGNATGMAAIDQFRQTRMMNDEMKQNGVTMNNRQGSGNLRRPVPIASIALDAYKANAKRQRTSVYSGSNVNNDNNRNNNSAAAVLPPEMQAKLHDAMRNVNLHAQDSSIAGANAAAAVAAFVGRALPPHALPIQVTPEKGLIYLDGRDFRVWPGGNIMPHPTDPNEMEELKRAAGKARKQAQTEAHAHAQARAQGRMGAMSKGMDRSEIGKDMHGSGSRGSEGNGREEARGLESNGQQRSSSQSAGVKIEVGSGRPPISMPRNGMGAPASRSGNIVPPSGMKDSRNAMEIERQNLDNGTNGRTDMDDNMSTRSVGQESTGPSISQMSSASGASTPNKVTRATRGRGSRRGRGRRKKDTDGRAGITRASPRAPAKRAKRSRSKNKKATEEDGQVESGIPNGNGDAMVAMGDDKRMLVSRSPRMPNGSEGMSDHFNDTHHIFGMLGNVHDGASHHGPDGGHLDDPLHGMPESSRAVTQGLPYDPELQSYLGGEDAELQTLFPSLSTDLRGSLLDSSKLL